VTSRSCKGRSARWSARITTTSCPIITGGSLASLAEIRQGSAQSSDNGGVHDLGRITGEPGEMGGQPYVRGLRLPVATVLYMLATGMTNAESRRIPQPRRSRHLRGPRVRGPFFRTGAGTA
jgi:hypothetical protein